MKHRNKRGKTGNDSMEEAMSSMNGNWKENFDLPLPSIRTEWVQRIASPSGLVQTHAPVLYRKEDMIPDIAQSKLIKAQDRFSKTFPVSNDFVRLPRMSQRTGKLIDIDGKPDLSLKNINERRAEDRTVLPYNFPEQQQEFMSKVPPLQLHVVTDENYETPAERGNACDLGPAAIYPHDPFLRNGKSEPFARTRHGREARAAIPLEQGGMFLVELDRAAMDGSLQQCIAGEAYSFGVSLRYGYDAAKTCTDLDRHMLESWIQRQGGFSAYLTGPLQIPCNCTHIAEGAYAFAFSANQIGAYQLWVFVGRDPVPGCPLPVRFHAGPPHAKNCFISGLGLWMAKAGEEAKFEWIAKDKFGNSVGYGGHPFVVTLFGPQEIVIKVNDRMNGSYDALYTPTVAGQYRLSVTLDGDHVPGSPFLVTIKESSSDASLSTVSGDGIQDCLVGSDRHFLIEAIDKFGNRVLHGGENFTVELKGPTPERVHLIDMDDGTYAGTFTCRWSGSFNLFVTLDGMPVGSSPYSFYVRPGATLAQNCECTLVKMPMSRLVCVAGVQCSFTIFAKDRFGNQRDEGGDEFTVKLRGPNETSMAVITDNKDGTYLAEFTCFRDGDYFMDIRLDRVDINQSPFLLTVDSAKTFASECIAEGVDSEYGNGLKWSESGRPVQFRIQAMDQFGNKVTTPGDDFQVKIAEVREGIRVKAKVIDNGDGTYEATWIGVIRGEYNLDVTLKDEPIKGSPWRVLVNTGHPSASKCTLSGTGLGGSPAGTPASVLIESNDHYGNVVTTGGAHFEASLVSVDGKHTVVCDVVDHSDGTYTLTYDAQYMGEYFLAVRLQGEHVHESPFILFIDHGDTDPRRCKVDGRHANGNSLVSCVAGHPSGFKLYAYDRFGNKCSVGGDEFSAVLKGHKEVPVEILDHSDGSYTCQYCALWSGQYNLHIYLGGDELAGSPFNIFADVDEIHPPSCYVHGGGIYAALAGIQAEFHVQAKDQFENIRAYEDSIEVKIEGPEQVAIARRYVGDGQYDFAWTANAAGQYLISIMCNGQHLATSPYSVSVGPGIVSPINCVAHGEGIAQGKAGVENTFLVQSRDKFGNDRTLGGDKYYVSITGPSACETKIRDNENGKYTVHWTALSKGSYWISIILQGEEISGSPFLAEITPDAVDVKKSTAEGMGLLAIAVFRPSTFIIYSRDRFGNRLDRGGDPWEVSIIGSEVPAVQVKDNDDGSYTVTYQTTVRGRLQVYISLKGRDIPDCPFEVVCDNKVRRKFAQKVQGERLAKAARRGSMPVDDIPPKGEGDGEGENTDDDDSEGEEPSAGAAPVPESRPEEGKVSSAEEPPAETKAGKKEPKRRSTLISRVARLFGNDDEVDNIHDQPLVPKASGAETKDKEKDGKTLKRGTKLF